MKWSDFSGKTVALLGAGKENQSLIPFLRSTEAKVVICDKDPALKVSGKSITLQLGEEYLANLDGYDWLFRSPGMPLADVKAKVADHSKITSAMELFLSMYRQQVIGVTGTKGKGSTASMIHQILKAAGRKTLLAGNIGNSIFEDIDKIVEDTIIVMELSSFQLEEIRYSPHRAVVLSISPEHLQPLSEASPNYHVDLPSYIRAKQQITAHQTAEDYIIYSTDSQPSNQIGLMSLAKPISVSSRESADYSVRDGVVTFAGGSINLREATKLRGDHMFHNAAIACATCSTCGVSPQKMITGLQNFRPLPHRLEFVGRFGEIDFYDDSYATAPDATIAALSAFKDRSVVLILGGSSKGADFYSMAQTINDSSVRVVVLVGKEAGRIEESLKQSSPKTKLITGLQSFRDVVETAIRQAKRDDVVLLSPACASKDMFNNAADRGGQFQKIIHELF